MSKSNGKTFDRKMLERELANMEPENQILVKSLLDAADSGSLQKQLQKGQTMSRSTFLALLIVAADKAWTSTKVQLATPI